MLCVGVWGTVGSTERWPETVNLWEIDGWTGRARQLPPRVQSPHACRTLRSPSGGPRPRRSAAAATTGCSVPAPYSPTLAEAMAQGIRGDVYYHELVSIAPGGAAKYLALVEQEGSPSRAAIRTAPPGAFRTAMVNDSEAVMIWAIDSWEAWARVQVALDGDPEVARWRDRSQSRADWRGKLIVDSPLNPLKTGKILSTPTNFVAAR